jgi:molybdopterin converting factor small subunit
LLLTHVKDKVKKQALIQEAADEQYTVKNLRKRIKEEKEDDDNKLPGFDKVPSITRLRKL